MKKIVIPYLFEIEANSPWGHLYEFEKSLVDFFNEHNCQAENITIKGSAFQVLSISKKETIAIPQPPKQQGRPKSIPSVFKGLTQHKVNPRERDFKKGKILIRKGYLKK
jgi:hypothetical protein